MNMNKYINDIESIIITIIRMTHKYGTFDNKVESIDVGTGNPINNWITIKCLVSIKDLTKDDSLFIEEIENILGYKITPLGPQDKICFQFNVGFTIHQNNTSNNKQNIKPIGKCLDGFIKNFNDKHKEKI